MRPSASDEEDGEVMELLKPMKRFKVQIEVIRGRSF
jgi:hypothetical protein